MPLLVHSTAPKRIEDIIFHKEIYERLQIMSKDNEIPHIIFHGTDGSGKKTMINIFLRMIYGDNIDNLKTAVYNIMGSGNKLRKETFLHSDNHIIINPSGTNFDRYIVHEIVKTYAETTTITQAQQKNSIFKTIQISNLDNLSHSAQTSLRRMIETNANRCRFMMWCNNLNNVIDPLKSRCVTIRIPKPSESELFAYGMEIASLNKINIKHNKLYKIVNETEQNIKKNLWELEKHSLDLISPKPFEEIIKNICDLVIECDLDKIDEIRNEFYKTWITQFDGIQIFTEMLKYFVNHKRINEICKIHIILNLANIEYNLLRGRRVIMHFDRLIIVIIDLLFKYN
jgi:replication factor C subunit 3/5